MSYRYTMPPALTDTDLNLERYKLNPPSEWISGRDTLTRYTRTRLSAWFATEEIVNEESFAALKTLWDTDPPKDGNGNDISFPISLPITITANNAYALLRECNKIRELLNLSPSTLIPLTAGPSKATYLKDEEYSVVFSIDDTGTVEFHVKPIKQEITIELLEGEAAPMPLFEGISPKLNNNIIEYNAEFKVCVLAKAETILLYQTNITRTNQYPDVVFDGKPQTITLPLPNGVWKDDGGNDLKQGNSIPIESIPNPDRKDLRLTYVFNSGGGPVTIYVNIINNLPCKRCGKTYNRAENRHGACVWHPVHGRRWHQEYEARLETLSKYVPKTAIKVDKKTIKQLIKQDPKSQLLQQINLKLAHIEQKYGLVYNLSDISTRTIGEIKVIIDNHLADSRIPYDLTRIMKRLFTIEPVEQILNPFYFDFSDVATHPQSTDERNPNKHYGVHNGIWLCCGQQQQAEGCLIGWHNKTVDEPTFTHIAFHTSPWQCTEYINDPNTSTEVFYRALEAYKKGDIVGTIQLEMLQNRIYGSQLGIKFHTLNPDQKIDMMSNVLSGTEYTGAKLQKLLENEILVGTKITKIWIMNQKAALRYPNGNGQRYITDTKYVERLVTVVELVNKVKSNNNNQTQILYDNLIALFPKETATLKPPLTNEERRWKSQIEQILQELTKLRINYETRVLQLNNFWSNYRGLKDIIDEEKFEGATFTDDLKLALKLTETNKLPDTLDDTWLNKEKQRSASVKYDEATFDALKAHRDKFTVLEEKEIVAATTEMTTNAFEFTNARNALDELKETIDLLRKKAIDVLGPIKNTLELQYSTLNLKLKPRKDDVAYVLFIALKQKKTIQSIFDEFYNDYIESLKMLPPSKELDRTEELAKYDPGSKPILDLMTALGVYVPTAEIKELNELFDPVLKLGKRLEEVGEEVDYADIQSNINNLVNSTKETIKQSVESLAKKITDMKMTFSLQAASWIQKQINLKKEYAKDLAQKAMANTDKFDELAKKLYDRTLDISDNNALFMSPGLFDGIDALILVYENLFETTYANLLEDYGRLAQEASKRGLSNTRSVAAVTIVQKLYDYSILEDEIKKLKQEIDTFDNAIKTEENKIIQALNDITDEETKKDFGNTLARIKTDANIDKLEALQTLLNVIEAVKNENIDKQREAAQKEQNEVLERKRVAEEELKRLLIQYDEIQNIYKHLYLVNWERPTNPADTNNKISQMNEDINAFFNGISVLEQLKISLGSMNLSHLNETVLDDARVRNIIGVCKELKGEQQAKFLLFYLVEEKLGHGTITKNDDGTYKYDIVPTFVPSIDDWKRRVQFYKKKFKPAFTEVVANIATLLEPLQKAAEAREEKLIGKTKFNVMFDSETVGRKYGPINSGCKAALTAAISEYDIEIANESWSNDKPIPNFKTPTFFIRFQQNNVGVDAMVEALKNKSNLFFVLCTGTVKTEAFLTRTTSKVSDISATLYMVEQLNAYRRKKESSTSDKGGEEKLAEKKSLFTKFDVVFDKDSVYANGDKSSNCLTQLSKKLGLEYNIFIGDQRESLSAIEDENYKIPTFFITYLINKDPIAAENLRIRAAKLPNVFLVNVRYQGSYRIENDDWPSRELEKYKNNTKFDVKFSITGYGPISNVGGITKFQDWLKRQNFKYQENNADPLIDFEVKDTGSTGKVERTGNKIVVPYYKSKGVLPGWGNYDLVSDEIPTLRTAILTLLAESTAGSPEPTPPPRSPSPQPTPPPSTEETPSEEKSDVSTGGSASTEGSDSSGSSTTKTDEPSAPPKTPEQEFKGLADRLNEEIKKKRALATVLRIKLQLGKITTTNIKVESSTDPWRIPNNLEISGVTQRQEKFDRYDQYLLKRYYIWTLMLYAMETTHVSRTPDFIAKLGEYCINNETDHSYFTLLKNSNMFIHIFELDRSFRLLSTIGTYREFLNTLTMQDEKFPMDELYTKGIENDAILKTPHYEVPYWIWQPSLFYAYGMLSKYMQKHNLSIQSDFWVVSNKYNYAGILNNRTVENADNTFEDIVDYSKDSVEKYKSEVERVLESDIIVPSKKDSIGNRVHSSEFKSLVTNVLTVLLNTTFRKEIDALFSQKNQIVYTLWNSNDLHGYSILANNPLISAKKQQFEITEIVAKTHGRALFLRMYLDTLLFVESSNHDIWLIPKKKLTLRSDFPSNYQILQALPEKLLSTYSSWGFKRNFELQVPAVQILQDYTYLDNLEAVKFPTIKLKATDKATGKPVSFLPYGSDMNDTHRALYRLFGFDIDKNENVSWLNSKMNDLIFNVFTITSNIGLFYAGEYVDTPVKLKDTPVGLRKDELTVQLESKQKIQIPIWNASSQTIESVPVETLQQLEAAKVQMFILPQVLEITESKVTYVETKATKTSTRSKNIPILIDIAEIPVAYNPKWTQADALISFDEFVNNQSNLKKQVDKKRKELLETKPHLTNAEKYALILLGTENSLANRLAYLPNAINIDIQATLDFLNSLQ